MKNNNINFFLLLSILVLLVGCSSKDFDELSVDPNNPVNAPVGIIFTAAQSNVLSKYGLYWDRYAGCFVQTFAGNHATGVSADQFEITSSFEMDLYDNNYANGMRDLVDIINKGGKEKNWQHVGASQVLLALTLGTLTDVYGDLPYSQAFKGASNPYPTYDSQESIYKEIFNLLSSGISNLDKSSNQALGSEDIVYKGDIKRWKGVAYALMARYKNHLSKIDPVNSAKEALDYVDLALANGFSDNTANLLFPYDGSTGWQNPWFTLFQNNLIIASEEFMNSLINNKDPRKLAYFQNTDVGGDVVGYVGKPNGSPINANFSPVGPKTFYGKKDSPQLIMTYFELRFIEAEASLRLSNLSRAADALNKGVKSQVSLVTSVVKSGLTGEDLLQYEKMISDYQDRFADEKATSITLEKVMSEKRKAMFTMNIESWVDVRRHDYKIPNDIKMPLNAKLPTFIRRALYTEKSLSRNSKTPRDIKLTDRLWWDK